MLMGIFSIDPLIFRIASMGTMVAPICWVIAPTSEETTDEPRIRSRSEVLPWSTWPITHTIGVLIFGSAAISPTLPFARALTLD